MNGDQARNLGALVEGFNTMARSGFTVSDEMRNRWVAEPEIVPMRAALEDVTYRGAGALDEFAADLADAWSAVALELEEVEREDGARLLVRQKLVGTHRITGIETATTLWQVFAFEGERVARAQTFPSRREAEEEMKR